MRSAVLARPRWRSRVALRLGASRGCRAQDLGYSRGRAPAGGEGAARCGLGV
jgi:hypothetical protein